MSGGVEVLDRTADGALFRDPDDRGRCVHGIDGLSAGVEFGPPQRGRDASSREARGRQCETPDCSTVLSTHKQFVLAATLFLPTFEFDGARFYRRLALVAENGAVAKVFYPVFPPDRNAADVLDWLSRHRAGRSP